MKGSRKSHGFNRGVYRQYASAFGDLGSMARQLRGKGSTVVGYVHALLYPTTYLPSWVRYVLYDRRGDRVGEKAPFVQQPPTLNLLPCR